MVTRSQAAKRKAHSDLPAPPSKVSKPDPSKETPASQRNDRATSSQRQTSEDRQPQKPSIPLTTVRGEATAEDKTSEAVKQPIHDQPKTTQPAPQPPKDAAGDAEEIKKQERISARSVIRQLQIVIERRRVKRGALPLPIEAEKRHIGLRSLCERASRDGVLVNKFLKFMPAKWWQQIGVLNEAIARMAVIAAEMPLMALRRPRMTRNPGSASGWKKRSKISQPQRN